MRLLFVKHALDFPRLSGHDVYTFEMMKALASIGHEVVLLTSRPCAASAVAGLSLQAVLSLDVAAASDDAATSLSWVQERFRSYWGIELSHIAAVGHAASDIKADAVVVVGLEGLPYLAAIKGARRVWYPADEWVWHHLSLIKWKQRDSWAHIRPAIVKGVYERAYRRLIDRVWVVTKTERRAMRRLAGMRTVDVLPLGIDAERYKPLNEPERPRTAVFWGRLDFAPNIQALEWFCQRVWPLVRESAPDSRFTIVGFNPGDAVRKLTAIEGVALSANLEDLRTEVSRHQVVVLPFVSGGGIKNKLLEAASLRRAIVCSPRACSGLVGLGADELISVRRPSDWCEAILGLWNDDVRRTTLGIAARKWVMKNHDWEAIAARAVETLSEHKKVPSPDLGGEFAA